MTALKSESPDYAETQTLAGDAERVYSVHTPVRRITDMPASPPTKVINFRAPSAKQALIDQAAEALGKSRTEFILEASCEKAREVLADRTHFVLKPEAMKRFLALIEAPPENLEAQVRLLNSRSPWER
jgi:uncharacterized protein (DUF1778 family)